MTNFKASEHRWVSWNQEGDDYRPIHWPPPEEVLAYWCSGYGDDYACVVALVKVSRVSEAEEIIKKAWDPGVGSWRFNDQYSSNNPPGERFPAPEWSIELNRWPWPRDLN